MSTSGRSTPLGITTSDHHASHPAHKLLAKAHPHDEDSVTRIFTEKIIHKPLLLSASTDHIDKRAARRHERLRKKAYALKHAKPKPLSAKEKRALGLHKLKSDECKYEIYKGLNKLWQRYILEVLGYLDRQGNVVQAKIGTATTASSGGSLLASADFHGMEVEVVKCTDMGRVGLKGIVVRETRSTLLIVCNERESQARKLKTRTETSPGGTEIDKVRMVLKKGAVFRVRIELPQNAAHLTDTEEGEVMQTSRRELVFELNGSMLEVRPTDRSSKKFKFRWKAVENA